MSARAGVVVTGTEVLTGRVRDRNGPWLSDRLHEVGVDLAHVGICGDRPEDLEAQLRFMAEQGVDVIFTSGGLGPTADDLTLEVVARFTGRELELDEPLSERIAAIVAPLTARWPGIDAEAVRAANRKQAQVPRGATPIEPAGTAPGMLVPAAGDLPAIVVLPGPPRELHAMWPTVLASEEFAAVLGGATEYERTTLRLFGMPESEIAETLRVAEQEVDGFDALEITTCLRRGEVEVVTRFEPAAAGAWTALAALIGQRHADTLFSTDGSTVDELIDELLGERRLAVAESCTGGLLAARLTERPGSSGRFLGGVVTYSDEAKRELLGVDGGTIERHGAVSAEVAEAMADGALRRFGAHAAISITGIAGPDGGTPAKPVGTVFWCVKLASGESFVRGLALPGGRAEVRDRSTTVALHMLLGLLRRAGRDAPAPVRVP